jgi:glycosyltransferase involved in cell wall biosynthesis
MLSREIPMIHLYIHGWGDYRKALVDMVNRLDLKRYISFSTHGVPTSELPALINRSSICLVPYRRDVFTDGILPTKLMEYAALGKPIITVKTPAIARYFDETMVDFIAPGDVEDLANAIRRLYYHPDRMAALSSGCLQFRQRYNWTAISTKYVSLVKRLGEYQ